jgi:hypothetical protein
MNTPKPGLSSIYTRVIPGIQLVKRGVYVYECPECKNRFRFDDLYEPICTGPSANRDEHTPRVMRLLKTSRVCPSPFPTES